MPADTTQTDKIRPFVRAFNVTAAGFVLGCLALVLSLPGNFQALKGVRTQADAAQFVELMGASLGEVQASLLLLALVAFSAGVLLLASYRKQEFLAERVLHGAQNDSGADQGERAPQSISVSTDIATQAIRGRTSTGVPGARAQAEFDIAIAENERLRSKVDEMNRRVDELATGHARFIARLGRDLLTPVNSMVERCDQLQDTLQGSELDGAHIEPMAHIRLATRDLLDRIDVLEDFASLNSRQFELEAAPFDLLAVIEEECYVAEARDLHVTFDPADDLPSAVVGDRKRLRVIVQAMLDNAARHSAQSEIQVSLSCMAKGEGDRVYCIDVQDSGDGIPPEQQLALWKALAADEVTAAGALGPALSVANALVKRMRGRMLIKSRLGEGTLFCAEIQLDDVAKAGRVVDLVTQLPIHSTAVKVPVTDTHHPQVLDVSAIEAIRLRQTPGQPDVVSRAVSAWLTCSEYALADARQACDDHDTAGLLASLLALSSGSRFVGAEAVAAACQRAEREAQALHATSQSTPELTVLVPRLDEIEQACNEVKPALKRLVSAAA
jgi:signal transduction histidine kinase/HPt (histidine-containing phosphotransfer) domain-containing protein